MDCSRVIASLSWIRSTQESDVESLVYRAMGTIQCCATGRDKEMKTLFFYGIAGAAMLALASAAPRFAVVFMLILVAGVFLINWKDYAPYLSPPVNGKFGG